MDAELLDRLVSAWLVGQTPTAPGCRRVIAVDGKTVRGARSCGGRAVHLLAAFDTGSGVVLGQSVVAGKTNEVSAFGPLLDRIDLAGAVVTADALHTQRAHCQYLIGRGGHYLLTVKANQPRLLGQLRALPWADVPVADTTTSRGHGRTETRTIKLAEVAAGIGFPHARIVLQITGKTRRAGRRLHTQTVYAITDLTVRDAHPAELADALRTHWHIENRLHWVRDVSFARRPVPDPDRPRPSRHGDPAQPRDQPAPPRRRQQHRRRHPTRQSSPCPRPTPNHECEMNT